MRGNDNGEDRIVFYFNIVPVTNDSIINVK